MRESLVTRRAVVVTLALGLVTGGTLLAERRPTLFVFVPALVRSRGLVGLLQEFLPGVEITAFGRFADFMSAVNTLKPTAALSLSDALEAIGLTVDLQGTGAGGTEEPYVLLTHRDEVSLQNLQGIRLGVVDVVGRSALVDLVQRMLRTSAKPTVRRVLKIGDLLPLLSLNLADAILLPERLAPEVMAASRLKLRVLRPPDARLGRTALAYPDGNRVAAIQTGIQRLSQAALDALGIEGWEAPR